ncbi:nitroreductase family protein [Pseudoscardovia radai]|uniref:nitroreductase family protein n=1 Tax=Pseudoscardovia radai TaxID=987066 RepID=UPI0039913FFB
MNTVNNTAANEAAPDSAYGTHDEIASRNGTLDVLLNRRSIRAFTDEPVNAQDVDAIEAAAQRAATSQFYNAWSAIRITDEDLKKKLAEVARQPYVATAPLLYVFIADQHRNYRIAEAKGVAESDITYGTSFMLAQAQNDAVLALHAMETAAESLGLGGVILGSLLNNIDELIELLHLPEHTFPVLGLALGHPAQQPQLKPRMPRELQFFDNAYPSDDETPDVLAQFKDFDATVREYYDLRDASKPVAGFTDQIAQGATSDAPLKKALHSHEVKQGFAD